MRVLIADDGTAGDDLAHHLKTLYGAECFRARSAEEGLQQRKTIRALDFVVWDLSYPDSSREESLKCIPELARDGMRVFVYTGYEEQSLLQKSLDNGATDWFLKGDNHRGGSALAARMAALYYRQRGPHEDPEQREKIASGLLESRKEQAQAMPPRQWLSTANLVIGLSVLVVVNLAAMCIFMWAQGGSNALFRNRVETNTGDITALKQQQQDLHDKANESKQNRINIEARQNAADQRANAMDTKLDGIRTDMNAGFQRIYEILLADRKTNADNRSTDQQQPRR